MVPIVINNFNRVTTTRKLVDDLVRLGYTNIHIIDNNSTYPELLKWYDVLREHKSPIQVHRLSTNTGSRAIWDSGLMSQFSAFPWIVYTDSDIELNENAQSGFIEKMIAFAERNNVKKVGLALRLSDLPDTEYANTVKEWEAKYWLNEIFLDTYKADVDTTFAIIKPNEPFDYNAYRLAGTFEAKHIPWYTDFKNLSTEEQYVLDHSESYISTYKGHYLKAIAEVE